MRTLGIIAAVLAGLYALWNYAYPTNSFRYRLTLEVSVDGQPVAGSGVIEVTERRQPKIGSSFSSAMTIRGQAVAVDLGSRGVLFALLQGTGPGPGSNAGQIVYATFPPPKGQAGGAVSPENLRRYQTQILRAELSPPQLPLLVRFREINDPTTVERVDPRDLAASFGSGVSLQRATLETTRDAVTTGIERMLPWLPARKGVIGYLHGRERSRSPAVPSLNGSEFSTGLFR